MEQVEEIAPLPDANPPERKNTGRNILIAAGVILVLLLVATAVYGMATHPEGTAILRDISIIVLALVTIVIGLFLTVLIFQLQSLISLLRTEIKPILDSTNETVSTVRGTTTFVSDSVVSPMINVLSFASGLGRTALVLVRGPSRSSNGRHKRRQS